ncbi:GNAT family N-acetyltransferase [uncultured Tessaracoccus sp.]|uniref:GNAT family N-acetyltransferase n=1 Tax=uncultured Tessaracoccus sp. TaxID=905023 RepID=UPI0025DF09AC|nr:GNAT family N-acetyltransferase [uncultured Tessaracoccus sp.]
MTPTPATRADLPGLVALEAAFPARERWSETLWADELAGPGRLVLVERADGRLLGAATWRRTEDVADLDRIVVAPEARRRGVADALLGAGTAQLRCRTLLEVRDDNAPAIALYTKHGFTTIARRPDYYGAGRDALVMERKP